MRKLIRSFLQRFGYDIVKYKAPFQRSRLDREELLREYRWLENYHFKTIVDVGSNEGQFSDKMRMLFPKAVIYGFEPLPSVFERLKSNFLGDEQFHAINQGLGDRAGEIEIRENESSASSSFLVLGDEHKKNFEEALEARTLMVKVDTLDNFFTDRRIENPLLLKMDVQGFEDKVIAGGKVTLQKASVVICELSYIELYKGQPLFETIFELFKNLGFIYSGSVEQLRSPDTNKVLQEDGIFIKK